MVHSGYSTSNYGLKIMVQKIHEFPTRIISTRFGGSSNFEPHPDVAENSVFDTLSSRKWIDFLRSNYHLHHLHHLQAHLHVSFLTSDSKTFRSFCASSERSRPRNLRHDVAWGFCFAATKDWKVTFCNQNARKIGLTKSCIIEGAWNLQKHDLFSRISHHLNPFHQQHGAASSLRAEAHESSQDD